MKQAQKDADYLIIKSALEIEKSSQFVDGDIDFLVIMTASINSENIFFLKPGEGNAGDALYFEATLSIALHIWKNILFLHAFSGCYTTFALFRQGKKKFMNVLNSTELQKVVNIFRDENAYPDDIDEAGRKVLIVLNGGKNIKGLRFKLIQKSLVKNFNLASLTREHSLRAYLQVKLWSGFAKSISDWGWKETKHGLFPVTTHKEPGSPAFLAMICKCAKGYNLSWICRKAGIK
ncbi:hypothetical protein AVEN_71947-1 [Araneus ventricosus]|uniref:Uncharacterized protein n=1 Tax=Araneus ventricosus TaxID=182803 RepID=A0A4Y2F798_ARAVE|nr:hypothetical protein AVEN_71947-1 [Araneus ventricosus]